MGKILGIWKEVNIVFIPKARKAFLKTAKDFGLIIPSSFVLKAKEKIYVKIRINRMRMFFPNLNKLIGKADLQTLLYIRLWHLLNIHWRFWGILPPLLWLIVVNNLLVNLDNNCYRYFQVYCCIY